MVLYVVLFVLWLQIVIELIALFYQSIYDYVCFTAMFN